MNTGAHKDTKHVLLTIQTNEKSRYLVIVYNSKDVKWLRTGGFMYKRRNQSQRLRPYFLWSTTFPLCFSRSELRSWDVSSVFALYWCMASSLYDRVSDCIGGYSIGLYSVTRVSQSALEPIWLCIVTVAWRFLFQGCSKARKSNTSVVSVFGLLCSKITLECLNLNLDLR